MLGGILDLHGVPGMLGNLNQPSESSPETEALEALLDLVIGKHGLCKAAGEPFTSRELTPLVQDDPDLQSLFYRQDGGNTATQVGMFLSAHRSQFVKGHQLVRGNRRWGGYPWVFTPPESA